MHYQVGPIELEKQFQTSRKTGLSSIEAKKRLTIYGQNQLPSEKKSSLGNIFISQFSSPLIYILMIATVVTVLMHEYSDAIIICLAVAVNVIMGFIQEYKASRTLEILRSKIEPEAKVLRDSDLKIVKAENLVPGDILILEPETRISADARLFQEKELRVNEMSLTGEWLSATKQTKKISGNQPLADRNNMVYMGTTVEYGEGGAIIVATGQETEFGKIVQTLKSTKEEITPYQSKIIVFSRWLAWLVGIFCLLIFLLGRFAGHSWLEMFEMSIAIAVSAIPEGLPIAITTILVIGMTRILRHQGLVRKMTAAETLGSTQIIATDKTATLTEGKMVVDQIVGQKKLALKIATLNAEVFIEQLPKNQNALVIRGKPTDKALYFAGLKAGIDKKQYIDNRIYHQYFNPIEKYAASVYRQTDGNFLFVSGAPEKIISMSKLSQKQKNKYEKELQKFTSLGFRVIATGYKHLKININKNTNFKKLINNLDITGLIILRDPVRNDVKESINSCRKAGIKVIMITGDHRLTAVSIGSELGFPTAENNVIEGWQMDEWSDLELKRQIENIYIYARVEPKHKLRIVSAWQEKNNIIAMTGDGINDVLALKKANVGVAIGSGTEAAKETADLILLNDSFVIIVKAVEEGRTILENIRRVVTFLLSGDFSEIILVGTAIVTGWPLPIIASQILWINLVENGLLAIGLAFETKDENIMKQKPYGKNTELLNQEMKVIISATVIIGSFFLILTYILMMKWNLDIYHIRTVIFAMLAMDSIMVLFSCRNLKKNIWQIDFWSNKLLLIFWLISASLLFAGIYWPTLNHLLDTVPLPLNAWLWILGFGITYLFTIETIKYLYISKKT